MSSQVTSDRFVVETALIDRCMTIAQCSVAVLIKLFIRFPLEPLRISRCFCVYRFVEPVRLDWSFAFFTVSSFAWRSAGEKKKQLQLQIGGIRIHVGLLVKQCGGCLRAPGGGGGVVFPACVK